MARHDAKRGCALSVLVVMATMWTTTWAFAPRCGIARPQHAKKDMRLSSDPGRRDDPLPEIKPGEIDWDEEWQKVRRGEQDNIVRPKGLDKSPLEREIDRTKRAARRTFEDTKYKFRANSRDAQRSFQQQDPKFYLSLIALVAFLPAILLVLFSDTGGTGLGSGSYIV
eukprot:CAMPEP_0198643888 /NCGR_PEP_ID=MMETSP1467-20131203/216_1 /TAXON_ID=1462469 /ORGANISM="unid. sp., Strain CCMP2135" /LENGTH=167 /DNA_ID=CAMNT_0044379313 /DNA_START=59 /DNA_END=562 /DNA_ORIENTATION=+